MILYPRQEDFEYRMGFRLQEYGRWGENILEKEEDVDLIVHCANNALKRRRNESKRVRTRIFIP